MSGVHYIPNKTAPAHRNGFYVCDTIPVKLRPSSVLDKADLNEW